VNVIVLPVLFEGQVKAVIELASFQRFSDIHLTFFDQLTEIIGIMLNTITATMRTEELLKQSQSLASELRSRQAELTETNLQLQQQARTLQESDWLVGRRFTMADVAMAPYVNRLAALAMEGLWSDGRLPRVADWFGRVGARPAFGPALVAWMPAALRAEMRANGEASWPDIAALLEL